MPDVIKPHILVIDDELSMLELLEIILTKEGYQVTCADSGKQAISLLQKGSYDLLLCDIKLGDINGIEVLKRAKEKNPESVVIMISAYSSAENAVEAMNEGAYDYVPKPFDNEELKHTIKNALDMRTIDQEKKALNIDRKETIHFGMIVGSSPGMLIFMIWFAR